VNVTNIKVQIKCREIDENNEIRIREPGTCRHFTSYLVCPTRIPTDNVQHFFLSARECQVYPFRSTPMSQGKTNKIMLRRFR
jgi:hypothetical protein